MAETVNGKGQILDGHIFIYPKDEARLDMPDLLSFMRRNILYGADYRDNYLLYTGDHPILHQGPTMVGPDNRLVVNLPHYIVDTYNGFFAGIPAKITIDDDDKQNEGLQDWNDANSLQDKLNEISKQVDVYGRTFAFIYQDEDANPRVAYANPTQAFMIYDDTVAQAPYAFVRYWKDVEEGSWCGEVYYADGVDQFNGSTYTAKDLPNPYQMVPAVEFYANAERQGVFDNAKTLFESLNKVMSQKANQVEYFDQAYLKMLGVDLDEDGDGKPDIDIRNNRVIYSPDADATNAVIDFIQKPDGDTMQEHLIDRLVKMIHEITMVPDLNDEAFSGNSSGVALQYKLLSMRNMASTKERKFSWSLKQLYRIVFSLGGVVSDPDAWQAININMPRNLPSNLAEEVQTAVNMASITSKQTALKVISAVDDPQKEMERIKQEQADAVKQSQTIANAMPDYLKENPEDETKASEKVDNGELEGTEDDGK
ncbi:phage portal protein [Limosilactobacillus fermentum]|uniref:phage portal protein n=1 Tax=Limosilactobacillus fermentum TaxID=1613 RepID=UPI001881CC68|nr:phage portal protein [Limosilactobacillus fermentum]MBE8118005.1 phage portal protein [Limosilactobacillus fermentum]